MIKHAPWLAAGLFLVGCQTNTEPKGAISGEEGPRSTATFEQEALHLTQNNGELVLSQVHMGLDRKVALVIRYSERADPGEHCTLSIIEQVEGKTVLIESSNQVMSCTGISVPDAGAVKAGLEAKVEPDFIRLDEDRIRNRSEYELVRGRDGRWHLAYSADIGPEHDPDTGELLVVGYAVAYRSVLEGPAVSEVDRMAIKQARDRSVY